MAATSHLKRWRLPAAVLAVAVVTAACAPGTITEALDAGELQSLGSVGRLADAFAADTGAPRLVLILSPT